MADLLDILIELVVVPTKNVRFLGYMLLVTAEALTAYLAVCGAWYCYLHAGIHIRTRPLGRSRENLPQTLFEMDPVCL